MQIALILYGTQACHLCEEAGAMLAGLEIEAVHCDIVDDDSLLELYGVRIPVLKRLDTGAELGWPFDATAIARFLSEG